MFVDIKDTLEVAGYSEAPVFLSPGVPLGRHCGRDRLRPGEGLRVLPENS